MRRPLALQGGPLHGARLHGAPLYGALVLATVLATAAALAQPPTGAPAPSLTVTIEPAAGEQVASEQEASEPGTITIGDRVEARLTLQAGPDLAGPPRFPVWAEHWGAAEILDIEPPIDRGGGVWTQILLLAVFETGEVALPAVEAEVPAAEGTLTVASEPVALRVESVLPSGDEEGAEVAPQPPAPVRALPAGRAFWWTAAMLGLAFAALAFFVLRSARRIQAGIDALALSPIEAFRKALALLREERAGAERTYTDLSLELRRYLGRALGFPAAEGTTTQIQRSLRERQLPAELVSETLGLLREADQIKFARGAADPQRVGRRLDDAERLATDVETWLEPIPETEGAESDAADAKAEDREAVA